MANEFWPNDPALLTFCQNIGLLAVEGISTAGGGYAEVVPSSVSHGPDQLTTIAGLSPLIPPPGKTADSDTVDSDTVSQPGEPEGAFLRRQPTTSIFRIPHRYPSPHSNTRSGSWT